METEKEFRLELIKLIMTIYNRFATPPSLDDIIMDAIRLERYLDKGFEDELLEEIEKKLK